MAVQTRLLDKHSAADMALLTSLVSSYALDEMGSGEPLHAAVHQRLGEAFAAHPSTFALVAEDASANVAWRFACSVSRRFTRCR